MQRKTRLNLWLALILIQLVSGASVHATITVLDFWRMGENDPGAANGVTVTNTMDIVGTNNLQCHGPAQYTSNVAATAASHTGTSLSVSFTNSAYATNSIVSTAVNNFGLECWVKPTALGGIQIIAYNGVTGGVPGKGGWGLMISANTYQFLYGGVTEQGSNNVATANVWTHLAVVCDSGTTTLYVNGAPTTVVSAVPVQPIENFGLGGPPESPTSQFFTGLIDEVRVFTFTPGQFSTNDLLWNQYLVPSLNPLAATNVTAGSATLATLVNPNGLPTTAWFTFGATANYGQTNFIPGIGSGNSSILVTNNVSGLVQGTVYHFRAWASNSFGVTAGLDQTFVAVNPPALTTQPATGITGSGATLNGTVQANGSDTFTWFQYGATTNYGSNTPLTVVPGTTPTAISVSNSVSGLSLGVPYHYRLVGTNVSCVAVGADAIFTPSLPPTINTWAIPSLTPTNVVLNATITPNGADTGVYFDYGTTTGYSSTIGPLIVSGTNSGQTTINTPTINSLSVGQTYHYQIIASNVAGVASSGDLMFTTPSFVQAGPTLPGPYLGAAAWGDFDNDGLLDLVIVGMNGNINTTEVWHNNGDGTFSNLNANITGVTYGSVALGDYDGDGLLDILITGLTINDQPITQVWRNTGNGFTNINAGLTPVYGGSVAWGDYDNDGRLDILLSGINSQNQYVTEVWRNTGNGFTNINAGLTGVEAGSVAWGDYDNDGRLDILLSGENSQNQYVTEVWRNTGNGFTNINAGLTGVYISSAAWGDYDNDGRLDILLSGRTADFRTVTEVWRNTGNGFSNINVGVTGVFYGSVAWGDYDNDGRLDILLSGFTAQGVRTEVWRNTGNGFVNIDTGLTGVDFGSAAWGDFNSDGRLDCLVAGQDINNDVLTQLMQNMLPGSNSPPTAPTGLSAALSGSTLSLSWQPSSDSQTPAAGLSYNVRVGTSPGGSDILSAMAGANGTLRVPQRGSMQRQQFDLTLPFPAASLPGKTFYWSVQSVDTSFAGSPFAPEASFVVRPSFTGAQHHSDGTFDLHFNIQSGTNYTIEASTDLVHWIDIQDFSFGSNGPILFTDPNATNYTRRYYRFGQH